MYKKRDIHHLIENIDTSFSLALHTHDYVGSGCARNVFRLDENYVVKISRDTVVDYATVEGDAYAGGIHQSLKEIEVYKNTPMGLRYLINPIIDRGIYNGHVYIVQEYVEVEGSLDDGYCTYSEYAQSFGYDKEEIDERVNDIREMCDYFGLSYDDILEFSANIGHHPQRGVVIVDYGYPD